MVAQMTNSLKFLLICKKTTMAYYSRGVPPSETVSYRPIVIRREMYLTEFAKSCPLWFKDSPSGQKSSDNSPGQEIYPSGVHVA